MIDKNKDRKYCELSFFELSEKIIKKESYEALDFFIKKVNKLKEKIYLEMTEKYGFEKKVAQKELKFIFPKNIENLLADAQYKLLDKVEEMYKKVLEKEVQNVKDLETINSYKESEESKKILELINSIPGEKNITLFDGKSVEVFNISGKGEVGYEDAHIHMLYKKLDLVRDNNGTLILRQFIPDTNEDYVTLKGEKIQVSWKAIYGAILRKGSLIAIDAEELENSCKFNKNGEPLPPEEFVIYRDFDDLFLSVK